MKKLELKDIVSYLPYNLSIYYECKNDDTDDGIYKLDSIDLSLKGDESLKFKGSLGMYHIYHCKPILRPMTDLIKPIVVEGYNNGYEFVPLLELIKTESPDDYDCVKYDYAAGNITSDGLIMSDINRISYKGIDILNQWHFDYRDLISQGLAVNINDLNKRI